MKNKILIALLTLVLILGLSACGSDSKSEANFTGVWVLESMENEGEVINMEDFSALGLSGTMTLNEDLTLSIDLFGEVSEGKWKAKNATTMSMNADGQGSGEGVLKDGKLVMEEDDSKLVFVKG